MRIRKQPSNIHGNGTFATEDISKGELVINYDNFLEHLFLSCVNDSASIQESDLIVDKSGKFIGRNLKQLCQHYEIVSKRLANAENRILFDEANENIVRWDIVATKDISKGQEILRPYGLHHWLYHLPKERLHPRSKRFVYEYLKKAYQESPEVRDFFKSMRDREQRLRMRGLIK